MKRIWKSFWGWMLCICLLLQPLPSLAMDGEAKTEQKITVSLTDGGSVKVTDPKGTESEIRKADTGEPVTFTGTKGEVFQCEAVPFEGYEISTYVVIEDGQEVSVPENELQGQASYQKELAIGDQAMEVHIEFQQKETKEDSIDQPVAEEKAQNLDPALSEEKDTGKQETEAKQTESDTVKPEKQKETSKQESKEEKTETKETTDPDADRKALTKEGTNETSDMEALFGPKEGEEDTRLSAQAWKRTQQRVGTDRSAYADYTASREWHDVTIGTNDDSGHVIWQWTEGKLYIGGRLTFCMDATTSFYEGVQYTPTDMTALGLNQDMVTRLALYQEYIYNQRSDLDDLGRYIYTQMLIWRDLNQFLDWGWPNIHIFDANYWWASVDVQNQILAEAVAWVNEQQQSGRYTGHGEFFVHAYSQAQALFWLEENNGGIELYKSSAKPEITDGNSAYSLEGAQYGVYRDGGDYVNPDAVITTDANGYGWVDGLPVGNYWIKELKAPPGYALNPAWSDTTIAVPGGSYVTYNTSDVPITDPITIVLGKVDADKTSGMSEAELKKLEGAQFKVKYYAVDPNAYNSDPGISGVQAERTWVLQTKYDSSTKRVVAKLDPKYKVYGDEFFFNQSGWAVFPVGVITIQEIKAPQGYLVNNEIFVRKITEDGSDSEEVNTYNAPTVKETAQKMQIRLQKVDKETGKGEAQGTATLKGAKYEIRNAKDEVVETLTTDEKGKATSKELPIATYTVKETKASNGYILDEKTYTVKGEATDSVTRVFQYDVKSQETPQKIQIELSKLDSETNKGEAQGAATLKGAVYEVRNSKNEVVDTLKTDEKGKAVSKELLPGKYTVKETKASNGYLVDENTYPVDGNIKDPTNRVFKYKVTSGEDIIRGDVEIIKLKENQDEDNDTLQGLEGVEFTFTSKTTGKEVLKIVTDKYGFATTKSKDHPRGGLVYDTYIVTETKCPEGLKPIEPFEVTIKDEGVTLKGIYKEDKLIVSPVSVVKVDASTGKVIPVADTEFRILDENKKPITMTTHYPNEVVHETFKTDKNGQFTLPEKLKYGTYYLEEVNAPDGYLKGKLLQFKVTEGATWEHPLVVKYSDENVMGKIRIQKKDSETGEALANAVFDIVAAEDIVTPDGTIRLQKGEVAETLTTGKDGSAISKELFLGTYLVKETKQPEGYLLNKKEYEITLKYQDQETPVVEAEVEIPNTPTKIQIIKTEKGTDKPIAGAKFQIWNKAMFEAAESEDQAMALKETYTTDEKGCIELKYLAPGTYCIQEVEAAPGFVLDDTVREMTIEKDGRVDGEKIGRLDVENDYTKMEFIKYDATTKKPVAGGTFQVTDLNGTVLDEWDGTKEPHTMDHLVVGQEYIFKEVKAPNGYLLAEDVHFVVEQTGKLQTIEMYDENVMGQITIRKTDANTDQGLKDAEFTITASEDIVTPDGTVQVKKGEIADTITTGEDGVAVSKKLFLGNYVVKESKQPSGYVLEDKEYPVELKYKDEKTDLITEELAVENKPTVIRLLKVDQETGKAMAGVQFEIWKKNVPESGTEKEDHVIQTTDENGEIRLERFAPGTYCFQEHQTLPGYVLDETIHEVTISKDGTIDGKTVAVLKLKNVPTKLVKTTAKDQDTQTHEAIPKKETTLVDTVEFQDLQIGQEYTIKGTLMDKATGKPLLINGKEVTAETTFTAKEKDGTVDVVFQFDASALKGKQIVVFEKVFLEEKEILAHEDLEDQGQTVEFPDSSIGTTAKDQESGTHEGIAKKDVTIVDTVSYKNLIVGQEYTVKGKLMLKETGEPLRIDGKEVTAETTFVPEEADGSVDMKFTFDASALNKKSVVVFEKVYADETEVAAHEELEDDGQTVKYKIGKVTVDMPDKPGEGQGSPPVKTGDALGGVWLLLFAAFGCIAVIGIVLLYRRKRKEAQDEE